MVDNMYIENLLINCLIYLTFFQSMEKETLMDLYTIKMETQNSSTFDSVNNTTNFDANNDSNMDAHSSSNMDVFNPIVPVRKKVIIILEKLINFFLLYPNFQKIEKDDDDDLLQDMSSNPLQVKLEEYYAEESNSGNEYEEPKSSQPVTFVDIKSFPIEQILKESFNGEQIMDYYAENQTLNSKYRSMLGTCIVEYLVHNKLAPKRQQFGIIAENISDFFKNEDKVSVHVV